MSLRHQLVAVAGLVLGLAFAASGRTTLAALAVVVGVGAGVVEIDLRERRIPTRLVAIGAAGLGAAVVVASFHAGQWSPAREAVVGGAIIGATFLIVHLVNPPGMGFGDVRLGALVGAATAFGTRTVTAPIVVAAIASIVASLVMVVRRQRSVPYAPHLIGAAIAVLIADLVN